MSLRHAILAMLDVEPGTGYDLMTRFRRSVGFFWQTTHQQVYKELHALHEAGLVDCEELPQEGKPDKKRYCLNAGGEEELDSWLCQPAASLKIRDPLLVKLFAGRRVVPEAMLEELMTHRRQHEETLAIYHGLEQMMAGMEGRRKERYRFPLHTLRMGIHFERAWLAWCDEVMAELKPQVKSIERSV